MSRQKTTIFIIAALLMFVIVSVLPRNVTASQVLGITNTPTDTTTPTDTPSPTPTDTPTPTPTDTPTTTPSDTPTETDTPTFTPTGTVKPQDPTDTPRPRETEVVLLPETGEFPIDPQLSLQLFLGLALIILIGVILFRAIKGSKPQM